MSEFLDLNGLAYFKQKLDENSTSSITGGVDDYIGFDKNGKQVAKRLPITLSDLAVTEVITEDKTWTNPYSVPLEIVVRCFGGGGGVSSASVTDGKPGGGGGGHMTEKVVTVSPNESVPITIGLGGVGGSSPTNGGTTSFGTYVSANGGYAGSSSGAGNDGGTGGGGGTASSDVYGGNGSYGGGGGGGILLNWDGTTVCKAGNGGTYGGGGGAGGYSLISGDINASCGARSGGNGGTYGGAGGNSGHFTSGTVLSSSVGRDGKDTTNLNLDFTGTGKHGDNANSSSGKWINWGANVYAYATSGGAGGGGYGGDGGNGGNGVIDTSNKLARGGGGGGGGGYGANGGNGLGLVNGAGGGGGGGYGGNGGNCGYSGAGYGAGGSYNHGGGGGGGYGKTPASEFNRSDGNKGCVVLQYMAKLVQ